MNNTENAGAGTELVGFIGLGAMGGAISRNLLRSGVPLKVFDLRPNAVTEMVKLGATAASHPTDFRDRTIVILSLPGPKEFEAILFGEGGLIDTMQPGSLVIDMTSNNPEVVRRASVRLASNGIDLIDAPVAGGKAGAEQGTLTIAVGGNSDSYERARPLLEHTSKILLHAGNIGCGDVCKLVHNLGIHIVRQAIAEMFTLGSKAGVDTDVLFEFVRHGAFGRLDHLNSWFKPRILTGEFLSDEPTFRHDLALKDVELAVALADDIGVPLPLGGECLDLARTISERGWGDRDAWINFALQEERSGVLVREVAEDKV